MFGTIRRHQKWLYIVVSTITIISFVAFFSPQQQRQGGWSGPKDQIGSINGRPITRDQFLNAYREAELRFLLQYGEWPGGQSGMMESEASNRLFLLDTIEEMDIRVSDRAAAQWIAEAFRDPADNTFRRNVYQQFVKTTLPSRNLSQGDFERFARNEVAIQHLAALAGTAGKLVPPQQAESLFRREHEQMEAEAVLISSSGFLAQVVVDPEAVAAYYTNSQAAYRTPERLQVSYVKFAASNYVAEAEQALAKNTALSHEIESVYLQRGTNALTDATGAPLPPEEARQKIREEFRDSLAMNEARERAVEFANELFAMQEQTDALERLADSKGQVSGVTEPFAPYERPPDLDVPPNFGQVASRLTPENPFAEQLIESETGYYLIALKRRIASEVQPLEEIYDRVADDYQKSKALELARAAGKELQAAVTNSLAEGKSFQTAVSEQNLSPVLLPPFSRKASTLPGVPGTEVAPIVNTAFSLSPGEVSDFVPTRAGGFVLHVKSIVPVPDEQLQAELPEFARNLRQSRQYEAFADWFRTQMESARVDLPGGKQRASAR